MLVDERVKIQWAGCGFAIEDERLASFDFTTVLLERVCEKVLKLLMGRRRGGRKGRKGRRMKGRVRVLADDGCVYGLGVKHSETYSHDEYRLNAATNDIYSSTYSILRQGYVFVGPTPHRRPNLSMMKDLF